MAGQLDEVSAAIGALRADAQHAKEDRAAMMDKLSDISDQLARLVDVRDDVDGHERRLDKIEHGQARREGRAGVIGAVAATAITGGAWLIEHLWKR